MSWKEFYNRHRMAMDLFALAFSILALAISVYTTFFQG